MGTKRVARSADNDEAVPGLGVQDFAARLAKHGEAFMQMFDDPNKPVAKASKRAKLEKPVGTTPATPEDVASSAAVAQVMVPDAFAGIWSHGKEGREKKARNQLSPVQASASQPLLTDASAMKAERRRFMSGRTSDVHRAANPQQQQQQQQKRQQSAQEAGTGPNRGDFLTMQREVQVFGAEALDKKQRKQFDAWQLQNVKAVSQKPGRCSAAIGKGIAKKQAERQQKAREEAIASGMLTLKGSGKSKRRSDVDKGLGEDGGSFKGGMLRVKGAMGKLAAQKKKKGSTSHKRAFSSAKIGNLDGNSQKAWNVAKTQNKKMTGSAKKGRR